MRLCNLDFRLFRAVHPDLDEAVLQQISKRFKGHPYLVHLITGARHQIRAYFKYANAPLVGDPIYGSDKESNRLELHSWKIEMKDPVDGALVSVAAPIENLIERRNNC